MTAASPWYVYILLCSDSSYYTGITIDLNKRFSAHLRGLGGSYTRSHLPRQIVYTEVCPDRSAALKREAAIKRLSKIQKRCLIGYDVT